MILLDSKRRWNKHFQSRMGQLICQLKRYRQPNDRCGKGTDKWVFLKKPNILDVNHDHRSAEKGIQRFDRPSASY